jgi:alpha-1,3-rhamnosyltransferase
MQAPITLWIINFNQAPFLQQCLTTVAQQNQKFLQIYIIDDASTDNSVPTINTLLAQLQLQATVIINPTNIGITKNLHYAVTNTTTTYFSFLAADDFIGPTHFASLFTAAQQNPNFAAYFTNFSVVHSNGSIMYTDGAKSLHPYLKKNTTKTAADLYNNKYIFTSYVQQPLIPSIAVLYPTNILQQVGNYNTQLHVEDYYMWLKILSQYPVYFVNQISTYYRQGTNSFSVRRGTSKDIWHENFFVLAPYIGHPKAAQQINNTLFYFFMRDCLTNKKIDHNKIELIKQLNIMPAAAWFIAFCVQSVYTKLKKIFWADKQ